MVIAARYVYGIRRAEGLSCVALLRRPQGKLRSVIARMRRDFREPRALDRDARCHLTVCGVCILAVDGRRIQGTAKGVTENRVVCLCPFEWVWRLGGHHPGRLRGQRLDAQSRLRDILGVCRGMCTWLWRDGRSRLETGSLEARLEAPDGRVLLAHGRRTARSTHCESMGQLPPGQGVVVLLSPSRWSLHTQPPPAKRPREILRQSRQLFKDTHRLAGTVDQHGSLHASRYGRRHERRGRRDRRH